MLKYYWLLLRLVLVISLISLTFHIPIDLVVHAQSTVTSSITVTTVADTLTADRQCSLREAITAANTDADYLGCSAGSGDDTITLPVGTFQLALSGASENKNLSGDLDITHNLTIIGVSAAETDIVGDLLDRVFDVRGDINVRFESMRIRNGRAPAGEANSNGENGGGIHASGTLSTLTLNKVIVYSNRAGDGGNETGDGGLGGGIYSSGELNIYDSTIQSNYAGNGGSIEHNDGVQEFAGYGGHGGGVMALGTTLIQGSLIQSNRAGNAGNGILGEPSYSGNAGSGGGLANSGTATVLVSEFSSNLGGNAGSGPGFSAVVSGGDGGGIFNFGTVNIYRSTLRTNRPGNGIQSAVDAGSGGALHNANGAVAWLNQSSIYDNVEASVGPYSKGGGISNGGSLTLINTTIARNKTPYEGGGIFNFSTGVIDINVSTIAYNETQYGGGIFNDGGTVTVRNTLMSWNVGWQGGYDCEGTMTVNGYSFIRDLTKKLGGEPYPVVCTLTGDMAGVITGMDKNPLMSAKFDMDLYGGQTKSYILLNGSPLIDAGNRAATGSGGNACPLVDQRNAPRPQATYCDIGATEASAQFEVVKTRNILYTYPGQLVTFTITVTNIGAMAGTNVTVHDQLPDGLVFEGPISLSPLHPEASVAQAASDLPVLVSGLNLGSGETVAVTLPVRTELFFPADQVITNTARAFSALPQSEGSHSEGIRSGWTLALPLISR